LLKIGTMSVSKSGVEPHAPLPLDRVPDVVPMPPAPDDVGLPELLPEPQPIHATTRPPASKKSKEEEDKRDMDPSRKSEALASTPDRGSAHGWGSAYPERDGEGNRFRRAAVDYREL
jgi:hypothetical protein